jgi:ABC-type branched-subunit amino acid transport system ATPase component
MSLLDISRVCISFDGVTALSNVSMRCEPGTISAIVGSNGAGKTTLLDVISGFVRPESGKVLFDGMDLCRLSSSAIARLGIGRLFQHARVFQGMTVSDNIRVAIRDDASENPLWALARASNGTALAGSEREIRDALAAVGLEAPLDMRADRLSCGQQKLLALARVLVNGGRLLLLDEPTAGLSACFVERVSRVIRQAAANGQTILIIEHSMPVVQSLAQTCHFLMKGSVLRSGPTAEVLADPAVRLAYSGRTEDFCDAQR